MCEHILYECEEHTASPFTTRQIGDKQSDRTAEDQGVWRTSSILYSAHWVCEYLYILPWYRSHQNILLVDTSTSRATAFFRVGTTWVYSLFSRSMRRISWRLVNIRYGLFPVGEEIEVSIMIIDTKIALEDQRPQSLGVGAETHNWH